MNTIFIIQYIAFYRNRDPFDPVYEIVDVFFDSRDSAIVYATANNIKDYDIIQLNHN